MIWNLLTAGIYGLDYYVKKKVNAEVSKGTKKKIAGGKLFLRNCHNDGMIFGTLKGKDKETVKDISTMVLGGVIWEYIRNMGKTGKESSPTAKLGLSMALGGGLNNYEERRKTGSVTDYLSLNVKDKRVSKIVFNISDLFIFAGAALWAKSMLLDERTK